MSGRLLFLHFPDLGANRHKVAVDADANVVFLGTWNLCADFVALVVFGDVDADVTSYRFASGERPRDAAKEVGHEIFEAF